MQLLCDVLHRGDYVECFGSTRDVVIPRRVERGFCAPAGAASQLAAARRTHCTR